MSQSGPPVVVKFSSFLEALNLSSSAAIMLAIRHTGAYMSAITDLQKGVSG